MPGPPSSAIDPERDAFEVELLRAATAVRRPVLGVCRGAQLINVAYGGTLTSDLVTGVGESHAFAGYPVDHRSHAVHVTAGSRLAGVVGDQLMVNSYHHQSVSEVADDLVAVGRAPDGVIEAIELPGEDVIGVQWHPELLSQPDPLFRWLVERSSNRRTDRPAVTPLPTREVSGVLA